MFYLPVYLVVLLRIRVRALLKFVLRCLLWLELRRTVKVRVRSLLRCFTYLFT